jgi:hypothetical protein
VTLLLSASCAALGAAVRAEDFSWQLSGAASSVESDAFGAIPALDQDRTAVDVTYYFSAVDDSDGPLALAAFLHPTTQIAAGIAREDERSLIVAFDLGSNQGADIVGTADEYSIGGRYVWARSKWYAGGRYLEKNVDNDPSAGAHQTDLVAEGVLVGKYLGPRTSLELSSNSAEQSNHTLLVCPFPPACFDVPVAVDFDVDDTALDVFHVGRLSAWTYSLEGRIVDSNIETAVRIPPITVPVLPNPPPPFGPVQTMTLIFPDEIIDARFRRYSVAAELFPTDRLGVRLGYARSDGKTLSDDEYELGGTWFVRSGLAVQLAYSRARMKESPPDSHATTLRLVGRF